MKPFSIKDYTKKPSRNVVTRGGLQARIICTDLKNHHPVIAAFDNGDGKEKICLYDEHGRCDAEIDSVYDLFFGPVKKMAWANLYCTQLGTTFSGDFYETEEAALKEKGKELGKHLTTFKVEWEE